MGQRNLICVYYKGDFVVAQYSQWGAPPDENGVAIVKFLRRPGNIERLKQGIDFIREIPEDKIVEVERPHGQYGMDCQSGFYDEQGRLRGPLSMTRNLGAKILELVAKADATRPVYITKELRFANSGVDCEWAYVVDLDGSTFEVFQDYAKKTRAGSARFVNVGDPDDTVPRFIQSIAFCNLPSPCQFVRSYGLRYVEKEEREGADAEDDKFDEFAVEEVRFAFS
jgi:hypothetical protein